MSHRHLLLVLLGYVVAELPIGHYARSAAIAQTLLGFPSRQFFS